MAAMLMMAVITASYTAFSHCFFINSSIPLASNNMQPILDSKNRFAGLVSVLNFLYEIDRHLTQNCPL